MTTNCARLQCVDLRVEPECYNLSIVRGTLNRFEVVLTDGFRKAVAINNDTIDFVVKDDPGGSVVFTKSNGPGEHSDPGQGETIFEVDETDTLSASETQPTHWVYEVRRTTITGDLFVHITGAFVVRPTI